MVSKPTPQVSASSSSANDEFPYESFASTLRVLAVALFAMTFALENFAIPSASMASTLLVGDHVLVDRAEFGPAGAWAPLSYRAVHRGDIIVFYKPTAEPNGEHIFLVKRVIGIPGDRIRLQDGIVYLNGVRQTESYAAQPPYAGFNPYRDYFPDIAPPPTDENITPEWSRDLANHVQDGDLVVPPGNYFAMGDNRSISLDSRYWGFVPRANIIGRPLFVYWSFVTPEDRAHKTGLSDQASFALHEAVHFFDQTRWSRTFHVIE